MEQATNLEIEVENRLLKAVEKMPAFPNSVQKVLELSSNINCPPKDLVTVIEKDPVMTMKILKIINSAYYSLPNKINSVSQSVVYLGINTVKNLALAFAAVGALPKKNPPNFDMGNYLVHSLSTACLARQLCLLAKGGEPSDAYIAGLLHDFGKVVLAQNMPAEYSRAIKLAEEKGIALDQAEREVLGVDHAFVGAMLTQRWQFPHELVECIAEHHDPAAPPNLMLDCVRVANQLSRKRKLGDANNPFRSGEKIASTRFGPDFDYVQRALGDIQRYLDEAMMFANVGAA
jgi:putative nucleotidyltransferase with HDIG domain